MRTSLLALAWVGFGILVGRGGEGAAVCYVAGSFFAFLLGTMVYQGHRQSLQSQLYRTSHALGNHKKVSEPECPICQEAMRTDPASGPDRPGGAG